MKRSLTIGLVALACLAMACGTGDDPGSGSGSAKERKITFSVTAEGTAKASMTYGYGTDTTQDNGAALPWTKEVTAKGDLIVPTVSAQADEESTGTISCKIVVGGKTVAENTARGAFAIVTCTAEHI